MGCYVIGKDGLHSLKPFLGSEQLVLSLPGHWTVETQDRRKDRSEGVQKKESGKYDDPGSVVPLAMIPYGMLCDRIGWAA